MKKSNIGLKHYSILFSILGIAFLYSITIFCKPAVVDLSKLSEYEGKEIITKGVVKDIIETKYGNQILTIQNNNSSVMIFSEEKTNVTFGDFIKAQGKVQKYKDSFELIVEQKEFISIIRKWHNKTQPVWQLSLDPFSFVGLNVKVEGYVDSIYNSYFNLRDLNKSTSLIVSFEGGKPIYLEAGRKVIVKGVFSYDKENFRYMLRLFDKKHGVFLEAD